MSILLILLSGCTRYRPALVMEYTKEGATISINQITEGDSPSWSSDGKWLAFEHHGIWIIETALKMKERITHAGTNPSWSPDGKKIAYAYNGIWVWERNLYTHQQYTTSGDYPCWSPDAKTIAFSYQGIWSMDIQSGNKTRLFEKGIPLSFSPDGQFLLIETWETDDAIFKLGILNLINSEFKYLTEGTKGVFAPDGESIVYSQEGIWIYSIIKRGATRLLLDGYDPQWSPTGEKITFCDRGYIWIIDAPYKALSPKMRYR